MAKKKRLRLNKKQRNQLWAVAFPLLVGILCLGIGALGMQFLRDRQQPRNLVWATDKGVKIPSGLKEFLQTQDGCREYRGSGSPQGVGLWAVFQSSQDKFAKISYGCSWSLTNYIMAVKAPSGWMLLPPSEYFAPFENTASTGVLPFCKSLEQYKIDKSIESFCITEDGHAKANTL